MLPPKKTKEEWLFDCGWMHFVFHSKMRQHNDSAAHCERPLPFHLFRSLIWITLDSSSIRRGTNDPSDAVLEPEELAVENYPSIVLKAPRPLTDMRNTGTVKVARSSSPCLCAVDTELKEEDALLVPTLITSVASSPFY
ncbi:hypothetical protein NMY22_g5053 [Coprinellus aureogranulatus]|nr:hypothetical protein NMY22_g5053 [Coprinellus aureogranulatus]